MKLSVNENNGLLCQLLSSTVSAQRNKEKSVSLIKNKNI